MLELHIHSGTLVTFGIAFILCGSTVWVVCRWIDAIINHVPGNTERKDDQFRNIKQKGGDR